MDRDKITTEGDIGCLERKALLLLHVLKIAVKFGIDLSAFSKTDNETSPSSRNSQKVYGFAHTKSSVRIIRLLL